MIHFKSDSVDVGMLDSTAILEEGISIFLPHETIRSCYFSQFDVGMRKFQFEIM